MLLSKKNIYIKNMESVRDNNQKKPNLIRSKTIPITYLFKMEYYSDDKTDEYSGIWKKNNHDNIKNTYITFVNNIIWIHDFKGEKLVSRNHGISDSSKINLLKEKYDINIKYVYDIHFFTGGYLIVDHDNNCVLVQTGAGCPVIRRERGKLIQVNKPLRFPKIYECMKCYHRKIRGAQKENGIIEKTPFIQ